MYQRQDFYRHARYVHGWLSAFAFLTLIFFAGTGLLLNNPEWFQAKPDEELVTLPLPKPLASKIQQQENPSDAVLAYVRSQYFLTGRFQSSEVMDNEVMIRLASPAGSTDVWASLDNNTIEVTQKKASTLTVLNDLHRGKNAGATWSWVIDITAILILVLSLAGFILFFNMKGRLASHLALTGMSLVLFLGLIWLAL